MGHRLDGNHWHRPGGFLLIPAFDPCVVTDGKVSRFDKGPGEILVVALGIAFAFLLAIGLAA